MNRRFRINHLLAPGEYRLADVYPDIASYSVLYALFPDPVEMQRILQEIKVFVVDKPYMMFVDNRDGSITIGMPHLQQAPGEILYLDIIHELCHVKQHLVGLNLYDRSKSYVDRETEIEAYRVTVQEARRIGFDDEAIAGYLHVPWITGEEYERLVRSMNVILTETPSG